MRSNLRGRELELTGVGKVGAQPASVAACSLLQPTQHRIAHIHGVNRNVRILLEQLRGEPSVTVADDERRLPVLHFG